MKKRRLFLWKIVSLVICGLWIGANECQLPAEAPAGRPAMVQKVTGTPSVLILDMGSHYRVEAFIVQQNHRQFGRQYGERIRHVLPEFEELVEAYFQKLGALLAPLYGMSLDDFYAMMIWNAGAIFPQVDEEYREEIEGLASQFSPQAGNVLGDGRLSREEVIAYNLLTDVIRVFTCSAVSVFGSRSQVGKTIAARNLDFLDGGIAAKLSSVLILHNGGKSVCSIGFIGHVGAFSMFNGRGVFGAILDIDGPYLDLNDPAGKRSYIMDLRHAIERSRTLEEAAAYMKDENKRYMCNHLIFFTDRSHSMVLENILSSNFPTMTRDLRAWDSELNPGIVWGIENAVGTVNSFVLRGNYDGHFIYPDNAARWESLRRELAAKGQKVSIRELQEVISYSHTNGVGNPFAGDLYFGDDNAYGMGNLQSIVLVPEWNLLKVAFRPRNSILPDRPVYETIPVFLSN